jgi:anaerobic selenocysteine-containing dehydrogenase
MNSSYGNVAKARKGEGHAEVLLHPEEAAARGLEAGTPVLLANETGQLPLHVALSDAVPRGVALVHKGRWPKLEPAGANVNVLNPGRAADLAGSCAVHSTEVEIRSG